MTNQLKTTKIQGKDYVEVYTRVQHFRTNPYYKGWGENSDIVFHDDKSVIIKCTITNADGLVMATGHAMEKESSSALGRALGKLGIGIEGGFASYEEVANAKENQETKPKHITLDIGDDNWDTVLNYVVKMKETQSFEDTIKTLQTKYATIEGKPKAALKKAHEGK